MSFAGLALITGGTLVGLLALGAAYLAWVINTVIDQETQVMKDNRDE